jgi:hypothetical protein
MVNIQPCSRRYSIAMPISPIAAFQSRAANRCEASSLVPATFPRYKSGHMAVAPRRVCRFAVIFCICELSPHHSWITMMAFLDDADWEINIGSVLYTKVTILRYLFYPFKVNNSMVRVKICNIVNILYTPIILMLISSIVSNILILISSHIRIGLHSYLNVDILNL